MSGIGQNRVFDTAALEELKSRAVELMQEAQEATEKIQEEMNTLQATAAKVPEEAKHAALPAAAQELAGTLAEILGESIYLTLQTGISETIDKLTTQIPVFDAESAAVLNELGAAAGQLSAMAEELKSMIGQGSLKMSLEEFSQKLEEYRTSWEQGGKSLEAKMALAMTYLKGLVEISKYSEDPVNLSTGNFYYEREDMTIRGRMPLTLKRHYNAMDRGGGILGQGWSHSLEERLTFAGKGEEKNPVLHLADGQEIAFAPAEPKGEGAEEAAASGQTYRDIHTGAEELHRDGEGYRCRKGDLTRLFDAEGRLLKIEDKDGNAILYTYDGAGRLEKAAQHPAGGSFLFVYKEDGSLKTVTDHTGRSVEYFYMDGRLCEVTDPEGKVTCYRYAENGKLRAVKNPRGILTVRNEYDEKGRISVQKFPDKGQMRYAYDEKANTTTLTERNGNVITYVQDERLRNTKIIYHDSEETTTYNDQNLKTSHTDRNGNRTKYRYDEKGNLTAVINALGKKTDLTYNGEGKLLSVSHAGREVMKNAYDENGRLTQSADALGRSMSNTYDESGLLSAVTAPDGSRTQFSYDERGNILTITDPYGVQTTYAYDELNRVIQTTDADGNVTRYQYDKKDRLTTVINPEGSSREYTYNPSGKVERVRDFDGAVTTITYNDLNRPETLTDKEGRRTVRHYDQMWNVCEEISPTGAVTKFAYDADNRLQEVSLCRAEGEEPGSVIRYSHDPAGNLIRIQAGDKTLSDAGAEEKAGADCAATSYEYDALNRVIRAVNETGGATLYTYDETGKLQTLTDPAGHTLTYTYNEAGELIKETDSAGHTLTYTYNALGQPLTVTDTLGRTTTHTYEKGGRLQKTTYPDGNSVTYTYDTKGRLRTKENSDGYALTYTYDCMDRVTKVKSSNGQEKHYAYDVMGNVTAQTDANGHTTAYTYTPAGKLSSVTDALGNRTQYRYDALDNLILIERTGEGEEAEQKTEYVRDPFGRVQAVRDALGREEHYTYDAFGRMKEKTDRDGNTTAFTYEPDGKTKSILYADGKSVEMTYDALRRLVCVKDWLGETTIDRDTLGQIEAVTDHTGKKVTYRYGQMGERTAVTYPDGKSVTYRYDEQLRLTQMQIPGMEGTDDDGIITYHYDERGRLSEKHFPDGLRTFWRYGKDGELTGLIHEDKDGLLDSYAYEYDPMGNKTAITRERRGLGKESGRYGYAYDALGRLAAVTKDGESLRDYAYDPFGNRILTADYETGAKTAFTYDALDRLTARRETADGKETVREYRYDNRGNLTQETGDGRLLHGYAYNAMNRLGRAWDAEGKEAVYEYNGLGQRTARETAGTKEAYLLDLTRPYHNLLGMVRGTDEKAFYWDGNVAAMAERTAADENHPALHYYLQDELGSPLRVSGYPAEQGMGAGTATAMTYLTYGYDEFGNDLYDRYSDLEATGIPNPYTRQGEDQPFGYTGYRHDEVSGTYFAQAREYQPQNGRFTAEDVLKGNGVAPETLNRYGYCWGNPVGLVDNDGRLPNIFVMTSPNVYYFGTDIWVNYAANKFVSGYDEQGQELINRYLYGDGSPYIIDNDDKWSDYMMSNEALTVWSGSYLAPIGENLKEGESIEVNMQLSMIIQDNNPKTGYMLIYGSNAKVGGYQIQGTISKGFDSTVVYDLGYTFNDVMDSNFRYVTDIVHYSGANVLRAYDNNVTLNIYDLHISWKDKTIIYADGRANEGWLKDMKPIDLQKRINQLDIVISDAEEHWWKRGNNPSAELTKNILVEMQNYMRNHKEYYGCFAD